MGEKSHESRTTRMETIPVAKVQIYSYIDSIVKCLEHTFVLRQANIYTCKESICQPIEYVFVQNRDKSINLCTIAKPDVLLITLKRFF